MHATQSALTHGQLRAQARAWSTTPARKRTSARRTYKRTYARVARAHVVAMVTLAAIALAMLAINAMAWPH